MSRLAHLLTLLRAPVRRTAGPLTLCACTDGGRNQPLRGCPACRGRGEVRR